MRMMKPIALAAVTIAAATLATGSASAQATLVCWDNQANGNQGGYVNPSTAAQPGVTDLSGCDGSVNKVFRNVMGFSQLTLGQQIQQIVTSCGLPNGPYRRIDPNNLGTGGDPRLDYVTLSQNNPPGSPGLKTLSAFDVSAQVGIPGIELRVAITGSSSANSATFSIKEQTATTSQIFDTPGFEFVLFLKSSGNQAATYVCDVNMWYGGDRGLGAFPLDHGVNMLIVGWAAGPSGFGSQANVASACGTPGSPPAIEGMNDGLTIGTQIPTNNTEKFREKFVGTMIGVYKTLAGDPPPPINVTACSQNSADFARYCDSTEPAASMNSCNPMGGTGGVVDSVAIGVQGTGTTCSAGSSWSGTSKTYNFC